MDEPSEGLAPTIVDTLIEAVHQLVAEDTAVLVVEQNLRAATSMAERQLVMVSGRIEIETTASELLGNQDMQRQYLGVE
jgi:branched-chain amino acid transport system ATP-binding protein